MASVLPQRRRRGAGAATRAAPLAAQPAPQPDPQQPARGAACIGCPGPRRSWRRRWRRRRHWLGGGLGAQPAPRGHRRMSPRTRPLTGMRPGVPLLSSAGGPSDLEAASSALHGGPSELRARGRALCSPARSLGARGHALCSSALQDLWRRRLALQRRQDLRLCLRQPSRSRNDHGTNAIEDVLEGSAACGRGGGHGGCSSRKAAQPAPSNFTESLLIQPSLVAQCAAGQPPTFLLRPEATAWLMGIPTESPFRLIPGFGKAGSDQLARKAVGL